MATKVVKAASAKNEAGGGGPAPKTQQIVQKKPGCVVVDASRAVVGNSSTNEKGVS